MSNIVASSGRVRQKSLMDRMSASAGAVWSSIEWKSVWLVRIIAANVSRATTIAPTSGIVADAMMDCAQQKENTFPTVAVLVTEQLSYLHRWKFDESANDVVRFQGTFSFEAGFAPQTPGFSHRPRYTYGLSVCTRGKRKTVYPEPWSHTSHVHGPVHVAIEARVSATKVCHRGILLCHFLMRGLLGVPDLVGLETMAQCEVPLKRKRLAATLVGLSV